MNRSKIAFGLGVLGVASLHFGASFFVGFAAGVSPNSSPWKLASKTLMFPLLSIPQLDDLPDWAGWPLWGALSFAWGFGICSLVRRAAR